MTRLNRIGFLLLLPALLGEPVRAAPPTQVDSLWAYYRQLAGAPDSVRIRVLLQLEFELADIEPDSAQHLAQQALVMSRRTHFAYGEILALNALAMGANRRADVQGSMRYLTEAVARARATGEMRELSQSYDRLADVAFAQQDFKRAARLAQLSLDVAKQYGRTAPLGALSSLVAANLELGKVAEARKSLLPLLELARRDKRDGALTEYQALAVWSNGMRRISADTAIAYGERALRLAERIENVPAQTYMRMSLMQTYVAARRWPQVVALAPKTLEQLRRYPNPAYEAEVELAYGDALHALRPADSAAFGAVRRALVLNDTLFGQEQSAALAAAQVRFDVAGQAARIRELEQQRRIQRLEAERQAARTRQAVVVAGALALLLAAAGYFYRRLQRSRAALALSEGQLRQANATKDQLMAIVGHDLRSPAAALQVVTPLLRELGVGGSQPISPTDAAEVKQVLIGLDASAHQLSTLIDTLLHWAREQTGALTQRPRDLVATTVVADAVAPYVAAAALAGVRIERAPVAPTLGLRADPDVLLTILRNLVSNAIKFSPKGGVVRVRAESSAGADGRAGVLFTVRNEGQSLDPARAARLLTPAALATDSTTGTRGESGTGLGLPLSVRFAALLGGEVRLLPTPEGGGTALGCWLPILKQP